jgi:hypothetical protein
MAEFNLVVRKAALALGSLLLVVGAVVDWFFVWADHNGQVQFSAADTVLTVVALFTVGWLALKLVEWSRP